MSKIHSSEDLLLVFRLKCFKFVFLLTGCIDISFDSTEEIVAEELEKQRRKLREITQTLDVQHQLLRLIIQVLHSLFKITIFSNPNKKLTPFLIH